MLVQLTQHSTQLQMTLAEVPQFEEFAADVELLGSFNDILHLNILFGLAIILIDMIMMVILRLLLLLHIEHLLNDSLILIEICHLSFKVVNGAIQIRGTVLQHVQSIKVFW